MLKNSIYSLLFLSIFIQPLKIQAQDASGEELKSKIEQFLANHAEDHKKKELNLKMREVGGLENEPFAWKKFFRLETLEEFENTLGYTTEREYYFLFYHYENVTDRQYALKYWMEDFIEGETIRPGRPKRTYDYAKPTIILINPTNIIVLNYECKYFDEYDFEDWRDKMLEYFGDKKETMIIELQCKGPLEWTLNAPDPKIRDLF